MATIGKDGRRHSRSFAGIVSGHSTSTVAIRRDRYVHRAIYVEVDVTAFVSKIAGINWFTCTTLAGGKPLKDVLAGPPGGIGADVFGVEWRAAR
jgi:hypothetical protein